MNRKTSREAGFGTAISRRVVLERGALIATGLLLNRNLLAAEGRRRVVVWSECTAPADVYPKDINGAVADALQPLAGWETVTANLEQPEQGLSDDLLQGADVLVWWGHKKHGKVSDDLVKRIVKRVKEDGMGFVALHSAHYAKPFKAIMLEIADPNDAEMQKRVGSWSAYKCDCAVKIMTLDGDHPVCRNVDRCFDLGDTERYSEKFIVPKPAAVPFECEYRFPDGRTEKARQCLCWTVGKGRVSYFQTGHETFRHYYDANVRQILRNAVEWTARKK
jgi:trehalose utilization protein